VLDLNVLAASPLGFLTRIINLDYKQVHIYNDFIMASIIKILIQQL